ncbi:30S ribosomal protein S15 [Nanoarchaeota archaeon]
MARMYSRKKGKSSSTKPINQTKPLWVRYKGKEIEMLVLKLAKEGKNSSKIGIYLRDVYGVPDVKMLTGKSITQILNEKKLAPEIPDDLMALIKKSVAIQKHMDENGQDMTAKRGLQLTESKIRRMVKFYKTTEKLPVDWKFDAKSIRLYAE